MDYASFKKVNENLLLVKFRNVIPDAMDFEEYLSQLRKNYESFKDIFVVVFDSNDSKYLSSELRNRQAEWIRENQGLIKNKCLLSIYVISNPIIRFILEAIFLMQKSPVPYQIVRSLDNAQEIAASFFDMTSVSVEEVR